MKKYPEVVAIDFDETIGFFKPKSLKKKVGGYRVKEVDNYPNPRMLAFIKELRSKGIKVVIYTSRWWGDYNSLIEWLKKHQVEVDDVLLGRFKADVYVCDKSINAHDSDMEDKVFSLLKEKNSWGKFYKKLTEKNS